MSPRLKVKQLQIPGQYTSHNLSITRTLTNTNLSTYQKQKTVKGEVSVFFSLVILKPRNFNPY